MKTINNINLTKCILSLYPNADFSIQAGEIIWRENNIPCPTNEQLEAEQIKLLADYESKQYQRDRLTEYPSIQECVHAILDDDLEALQAKRSAVKAKYPKPD